MDTPPRLRPLLFTGAWCPAHSQVPLWLIKASPSESSYTTVRTGWLQLTKTETGLVSGCLTHSPQHLSQGWIPLEASDTHCSSMPLPYSYTRSLLILRVTNVLADQPGWTVNFSQRLLPYQRIGYSLFLGERGSLTSSCHLWLNLILKGCQLRNTGTGVPEEKSGFYVQKKMLIYALQESQGLKDTPSWSDCQILTCCLLGLSLIRITGNQLCQLIFLLRGEQTCLVWLYHRDLDLLYLGRFSQSRTSQKTVALVYPLVRQVFTWRSTLDGKMYSSHGSISETWANSSATVKC